jgi:hypothetical protein
MNRTASAVRSTKSRPDVGTVTIAVLMDGAWTVDGAERVRCF